MKEFIFKPLFILIVGVAIGSAAGFLVGKNSGSNGILESIQSTSAPATTTNPPRQSVAADKIFSVFGIIKSINGNSISFELVPPLAQNTEKDVRKIAVNDKTEIVETNPELQMKLMQEGKTASLPKIKLADLKVGDSISVLSDENIKDKTEFSVTQIQKIR